MTRTLDKRRATKAAELARIHPTVELEILIECMATAAMFALEYIKEVTEGKK